MTTVDSLDSAVSDALSAAIESLLTAYGLEELSGWATGLLSSGATSNRIEIELEQQPAFQRRFRAIFARRAADADLPPISAGDILQFERQTAELESFYGLPEGTIDAQEAMINDQGYNELQSAVATEVAFRQSDPETQRIAAEFYGIGGTQGELLGAILNEQVGLPAVQQRIQASQVAAQAQVQGFGELTRLEAEDLAQRGVDVDVARQSFNLLSRSEQLTRDFNRSELLSLAAGETPSMDRLEEARQEAQAVFAGGGQFAGGVAGLGVAE
jgi:hypothetical protein